MPPARYLPDKRQAAYKPWVQVVEPLPLGIPGFYIVARFLAKAPIAHQPLS
jgi:hypothetical protein